MNHKHEFLFGSKGMVTVCAALVVSGMLVLPNASRATVVNLSNGNSMATVDLDSAAGMSSWTVDNQNQLNQQWFWYRIGSSVVAQPINSIGTANILAQTPDTVVAEYADAQIKLDISYSLTGGGPGQADITETISVGSVTGASLDFHLFEYSDFNLLDQASGDSVQIAQEPAGYYYVLQSKGATQIAEAVASPDANHAEAGLTTDSPNTLYSLNNTVGYTLNDNLTSGPGDATWAFEWDTNIVGSTMFNVIKDKKLSITPIPEPATVGFIALGLLGALGLARRRQ